MKKNNKKGFTLVELVIVVAVMAVLVAVAIPTIGSIKSTAEKNVADSNAQTVESMVKLAQANGTDIETYLNSSALGITSGKFMYNKTTGECVVTEADTAATDSYLIVYTNGVADVK